MRTRVIRNLKKSAHVFFSTFGKRLAPNQDYSEIACESWPRMISDLLRRTTALKIRSKLKGQFKHVKMDPTHPQCLLNPITDPVKKFVSYYCPFKALWGSGGGGRGRMDSNWKCGWIVCTVPKVMSVKMKTWY